MPPQTKRRTVVLRWIVAVVAIVVAIGAAVSIGKDSNDEPLTLPAGATSSQTTSTAATTTTTSASAPHVSITEPRDGQRITGDRFTIRGTGGPRGATVHVDTGIGKYTETVRGKKWGVHDVLRPVAGSTQPIIVVIRGKLGESARATVTPKYG